MKARNYTNLLLQKIEDGELDKDTVITALVNYMSEDDVRDCCIQEELLDEDDEEEDDE